jgi:hypothetical protein
MAKKTKEAPAAGEAGEQGELLTATEIAAADALIDFERAATAHRAARHGVAQLGLAVPLLAEEEGATPAPVLADGLHRLEGSDWTFRVQDGLAVAGYHRQAHYWTIDGEPEIRHPRRSGTSDERPAA